MVEKKGTEIALSGDRELAVADELKALVKARKLSVAIQGKEYTTVEGWQYAGARLGIIPITEPPVRINGTANEIKYSCSVKLIRVSDLTVVGYGYAICSNLEPNKKGFLEYAICSMAQTRAIGKAFRNLLAWVMKCAGFEATPAEEMDSVENVKNEGYSGDEMPITPIAPASAPKVVAMPTKVKPSQAGYKLSSTQAQQLHKLAGGKGISKEKLNTMLGLPPETEHLTDVVIESFAKWSEALKEIGGIKDDTDTDDEATF